jgi:hypothetical protein
MEAVSSICNPRTHHAAVTVDPLNMAIIYYTLFLILNRPTNISIKIKLVGHVALTGGRGSEL